MNWYKVNRRELPWRIDIDPYKILVSEIIFQQTRINQGLAYYHRFIETFPTLESLAKAEEAEVIKLWQGLGYYSRAYNLYESARMIFFHLENKFPQTYKEIINLKGVGKYTAAAIASIAFEEKVPAIDGNAFRFYSRLINSERDISKASTFNFLFLLLEPIMPEGKSGDLNQAVMDLASSVCVPKNPKCELCPVSNECLSFANNTQSQLPVKNNKIVVKEEQIKYLYVTDGKNVLIQKRDKLSIWKGLYEFLPYDDKFSNFTIIKEKKLIHKLTHKKLEILINFATVSQEELKQISTAENRILVSIDNLDKYPFPKPLDKLWLK